MRWAFVLLVLFVAWTATPATATTLAAPAARTSPNGLQAAGAVPRVALIGVPGLHWTDLDATATPNLWRLAGESGFGSLSVKAVGTTTCPYDAWLTVSAGRRAASGGWCGLPPEPTRSGDSASVPGFATLLQSGEGVHAGTLGDALHQAGHCTTAVGRGAALALADKSGRVDHYADSPAALTDWSKCQVTAIDVDELIAPYLPAGVLTKEAELLAPAARQAAVRAADAEVGAALAKLPPDTRILLAGLGDHGGVPHLRVALLKAPGAKGTYLGTTSTRRPDIVIIPDITASLLTALGAPIPPQVVGVPWPAGSTTLAPPPGTPLRSQPNPTPAASAPAGDGTAPTGTTTGPPSTGEPAGSAPAGSAPAGGSGETAGGSGQTAAGATAAGEDATGGLVTVAEAKDHLARADLTGTTVRGLTGHFFTGFAVLQVAFYLITFLLLSKRRRATGIATAGLGLASIPVSTYLVNLLPWAHAGQPGVALIGGVVAIAAVILLAAMSGPWRRHPLGPPAVVAGVTGAVLLADLLTGTTMQFNSLMGYTAVVGGRYYGLANIPFALLATAVLMVTAVAADGLVRTGRKRVAVALVTALGVIAMLLAGWPGVGSDFGGVIAFVPGIAVTALLVAGKRVSVIRLGLFCILGGVTVSAIAVLDHLRPPASQTHLGRFVGQVIDGTFWPLIGRKLGAMLHTLLSPNLMPIVIAGLAFLIFAVMRPGKVSAGAVPEAFTRAPMLRAGLIGALVSGGVGMLVNDSGTAVLSMAVALAVPLVLYAGVRSMSTSSGSVLEEPSGAELTASAALLTPDAPTPTGGGSVPSP
ncbi:hypothetical protein [Nonomuraea sp. NPDC050310]|uniref:hypothetical protein n=1 Tax=Nonomuraea sp. NPDC050310 TaxID=3154935 RepID=UPI0034039765